MSEWKTAVTFVGVGIQISFIQEGLVVADWVYQG
jgi:hypothetical protein